MNPGEDNVPRILILDYSVDRSEARLFRKWIPDNFKVTDSFVHFGDDIPDPCMFTHVMHTGSSLSICGEAPFDERAEAVIRECAARGIPQMGVCYGHQLLCRALLGRSSVEKCPQGLEAGWLEVEITGPGLEIPEIEPVIRVLESHFDMVSRIPVTAVIIARNGHTEIQAFLDEENRLLGLQFHPEFTSSDGNRMFMKEKEILLQNGIDPESVIKSGPSIDAGRIFFSYFLGRDWDEGPADARGDA